MSKDINYNIPKFSDTENIDSNSVKAVADSDGNSVKAVADIINSNSVTTVADINSNSVTAIAEYLYRDSLSVGALNNTDTAVNWAVQAYLSAQNLELLESDNLGVVSSAAADSVSVIQCTESTGLAIAASPVTIVSGETERIINNQASPDSSDKSSRLIRRFNPVGGYHCTHHQNNPNFHYFRFIVLHQLVLTVPIVN